MKYKKIFQFRELDTKCTKITKDKFEIINKNYTHLKKEITKIKLNQIIKKNQKQCC